MKRLGAAAAVFEPRGTTLAVGRSLLAFAELTVLLATPDRILFGSAPYATPGRLCSGIGSVSLWCVAGTQSHSVGRIIAMTILGVVVLGLWPRWLCVPHWYVAFSLATRMVVSNGGEEAAQILALLLIPLCLGDARWCHWSRTDRPMAPCWRGAAYAGSVLLRCQVAIIYLDSALSKLAFHSWRSGAAVPIVLNDPHFGLPPAVRPAIEHMLAPVWIGAAATWAVIAIEISIAVSMCFRARARRAGLALTICLHTAIIIAMGLVSFGLIMISLVMVAAVGASPDTHIDDSSARHRRDETPGLSLAAGAGLAVVLKDDA